MRVVLGGLATLPAGAFACSGPGAEGSMLRANAFALSGSLLSVGLAIASLAVALLLRTSYRWPIAMLLLVVSHPAWTISVYRGDCGESATSATFAYLSIGTLLFVLQCGSSLLCSKNKAWLNKSGWFGRQ